MCLCIKRERVRVDDDDDDIHGTSEINPVIYGELENIKKLVESYIAFVA